MSSTVPAAIAALVAVCQAAVSGADVFDGPPTTADYPDWIGIAYDPSGGEVVTVDTTWASLGQQRFEENVDITCTLGSDSGDLDPAARRLRAYELLNALMAGVAADYTLGGVVRVAHVSGHSLVTEVNDSGISESLRFTVNVQSRISGGIS